MRVNHLHLHIKNFTFTFHVMYILRFILTFAKCACIYFWNTITQHRVKKLLYENVNHNAISLWGYMASHIFHWRLWFSKLTRQDHNETKMTIHLQQVIVDVCDNARSCKMTMISPFKLEKVVPWWMLNLSKFKWWVCLNDIAFFKSSTRVNTPISKHYVIAKHLPYLLCFLFFFEIFMAMGTTNWSSTIF